jgi:N-alpha-acetyltransferase 15/16, NatA auxiliary subunit
MIHAFRFLTVGALIVFTSYFCCGSSSSSSFFLSDRSHVCWHVFGLLHRADHDYKQAASCYKQALRLDPNNLQILRDLSWLQLQLRDVHGFLVTRNSILTLKPAVPLHWVSVAVAKHMVNDIMGAVRVLDVYLETTEMEVSQEKSELLMYQNELQSRISAREALEHLERIQADVYDRGAWLYRKAYYLYTLEHYNAAAMVIREDLWSRGHTEDHKTHSLYMACRLEQPGWIAAIDSDEAHLSKNTGCRTVAHTHCSDEQRQTLFGIYVNDLAIQYPKSMSIAKRIPMTLITNDDQWLEALQQLCRDQSQVPSLYSEICFYICDTPLDPVDLRDYGRYKLCLEKLISSGSDGYENPLLAGGLYFRGGYYEKALQQLDRQVEGADVIDVLILKAEVWEQSGQLTKAIDCMQQARKDDPADRYLNNAATKLLLRNDDIDEAIATIALFTRHEQNLYEMQCSWYELELAAAYERKEDFGRALKHYGECNE